MKILLILRPTGYWLGTTQEEPLKEYCNCGEPLEGPRWTLCSHRWLVQDPQCRRSTVNIRNKHLNGTIFSPCDLGTYCRRHHLRIGILPPSPLKKKGMPLPKCYILLVGFKINLFSREDSKELNSKIALMTRGH